MKKRVLTWDGCTNVRDLGGLRHWRWQNNSQESHCPLGYSRQAY